jgi:hypothetical protein
MKIFGYNLTLRKDEPQSKIKLGAGNSFTRSMKTETLTLIQMRNIALSEPLFLKASKKKNRDTFYSGFVLRRIDEGVPFKKDVDLVHAFDMRTRFLQKLEIGGICKDIYGDGYLEKLYLSEQNGSNRQVDVSFPPKKGDEIIGFSLLNPEFITQKDYKKGKDKPGDTRYYIYRSTGAVSEKYIHPDRIIHIKEGLPFSEFGFSKIQTLKNILMSKMNTDVSVGEIIDWSGHGIQDMTINNMNQEQYDDMIANFKKGPDFYVHDEQYELKVENPQMGEPKSYFDYMYVNIAAAFEMPQHILTGVQPGKVIGTETGIVDYYKDIESDQKGIFIPHMEDVYEELFKSRGRQWKYYLHPNPIFIDELSEGKIMEKRSLAAMQGYVNKILGLVEARKIFKDGVVDINPSVIPDDIKEDEPIVPSQPGGLPNIEPKKPKPQKTKVKPLNLMSQVLIEQIKKERELGKKILEEQEKK